ncbi:helix-turn-helix domain-containing protein [Streptomyces pathocidini]|uniref:Helix-turn-helix domain-containing protein n=1 Tax=Streptomyces pathocidini TaxID=1650571 RepID=A0ABW7UST2_9ACTN|nr:helix-turn-helix domain-containing protein [Streptomyces pathocidini]
MFGFSGPLHVTSVLDPARSVAATSMVIGVHATATLSEYTGPVHGVTVILTPLAAYRLATVPMAGFACRTVDLADLLGARLRAFVHRLAEYPDWHSRFAMLDRLLAVRLFSGPAFSPQIDWAWRTLLRTAGRTPVGQLANEAGWSRRQLERRFLQQVGLPPKSLAQVIRLQAALRHHRRGLTWADVAGTAGYHDQAHFTRSFKAMIGCTPGQFSAIWADTKDHGPLDVLPDAIPASLYASTGPFQTGKAGDTCAASPGG